MNSNMDNQIDKTTITSSNQPQQQNDRSKTNTIRQTTKIGKQQISLIRSSLAGLKEHLKKRYLILSMCMMMNAFSYLMRTNINMTIVAMVLPDDERSNYTNIHQSCPVNNLESSSIDNNEQYSLNRTLIFHDNIADEKIIDDTKSGLELFDWSESLQGTILGAYYYGYIVTNFNGGQLAELIGTRRLLTIAMALSSLLTLLIPWASFTHAWLVICIRILTGLAQGVVTPSIYQLLSYWIPRSELGLAFGLIPASGYIGAVLTMPLCAYLSQYGFFGGWPSVFYVSGIIGIVSLLPWLFFVYDSPDVHPRITENELIYIQNHSLTQRRGSCEGEKANTWVPWLSIISSKKIWSICLTKFSTGWGNLFLMSKLPSYLSQVLNMPMTYNSYVNASIYISLGGSMLSWGSVADWVERRQCLGRTASRKLFQTIALVGSALFLASIPLLGCRIIPIIVMLNFSMITLGLTAGGDSLIVVDVAPDYAGSIYGFTNSIANLPGFLAPMFVGYMLDRPHDDEMKQWAILFWIGSAIYIFGALIFLLFVNSKPTSWGKQILQQPLPRKSSSIKGKNSSKTSENNLEQKQIHSRNSESNLLSITTTSSSCSSTSSTTTTTSSSTLTAAQSTCDSSTISTIVIVEPIDQSFSTFFSPRHTEKRKSLYFQNLAAHQVRE